MKIFFAIVASYRALTDWLRHSNSSLKVKPGYVYSRYGVWMKARPADATFLFAARASYGEFIVDWLRAISEPATFLDVGANQGLYSLLASKNKNILEIHAFEPQKNLVDCLRSNLAANGVENCIVHQVALGSKDQNQFVELATPRFHSGAATLLEQRGGGAKKVRLVGSDYLNGLDSVRSVYCKIDVEGFEHRVLASLSKSSIWPHVKQVVVEENDSYGAPGSLQDEMGALGFELKFRSREGSPRDLLFVRSATAAPQEI